MKFIKLCVSGSTLLLSLVANDIFADESSAYIKSFQQLSSSKFASLCGDIDGCTIRLAHTDGQPQPLGSAKTVLFYNAINGNWRTYTDKYTGGNSPSDPLLRVRRSGNTTLCDVHFSGASLKVNNYGGASCDLIVTDV